MSNMPFMDDLYQISDKQKQASKLQQMQNRTITVSPNFQESGTPAEKPAPAARKPAPVQSPIPDKQLKEALQNRYEEFFRMRQDLSAQVSELLSQVRESDRDLRKKLDALDAPLKLLTGFSEKLRMAPPSDLSPSNQGLLAEECRSLENMRLELIPLAARLSRQEKAQTDLPRPEQQSSSNTGNNTLLELTSLSFGQLFRMGFIAALPLMITVFLAVLLLSFAIIAAFNGAIRW